VSGVTKDAGPASCAVVASQWAGGAVRENEVLFKVFFLSNETSRRGGRVRVLYQLPVVRTSAGVWACAECCMYALSVALIPLGLALGLSNPLHYSQVYRGN
jgi:hypothetical protein